MTEGFVEIPGQLTEAVAELSTLSFWQRGGTIAALAGLSAVGLVACGDAQPSPSQPVDTRPAVASNAFINADSALNEINLGELSMPLATAENNHELPPPDYYGLGTSVGDQFPVTVSMPLFKVVLGTDNSLRVEDQTHGYEDLGTPAEQLLLGAVQQDSTLLTGLMKARSLDSIEFRVFDPAQSMATQTNQSFPEFVPKDLTDHNRNDIYDFLPAAGSMDQHSLALMLQHESLHAAFKQGEPGGHLSTSEKVLVDNACTTLRNAALQQAREYGGSILEDLAFMQENLASQYNPSVQKVIDAFQNSTYPRRNQYRCLRELCQSGRRAWAGDCGFNRWLESHDRTRHALPNAARGYVPGRQRR